MWFSHHCRKSSRQRNVGTLVESSLMDELVLREFPQAIPFMELTCAHWMKGQLSHNEGTHMDSKGLSWINLRITCVFTPFLCSLHDDVASWLISFSCSTKSQIETNWNKINNLLTQKCKLRTKIIVSIKPRNPYNSGITRGKRNIRGRSPSLVAWTSFCRCIIHPSKQ